MLFSVNFASEIPGNEENAYNCSIAYRVAIAVLISFMGNVTTYETIASAKQKPASL
jgi:hypothetical protein